MAYDEATVAKVRAVLDGVGTVREIKMMGALIFMVNEHMCCGVTGKKLMVRVGPSAYEQALSQDHVEPLDIGAGRTPKAFISVQRKASIISGY